MEFLRSAIFFKILVMTPEQILTAPLLDIVFEGRNKSYGAYDLRAHYQQRLNMSLLFVAGIILLFLIFFYLRSSEPQVVTAPYTDPPTMVDLIEDDVPANAAPPPPVRDRARP